MNTLKIFVNFNRLIVSSFIYYFNKIFKISNYNLDDDFINEINKININSKKILEVGCSDRPILNNNTQFTYHGMDVDNTVDSKNFFDKFILQSVEKKIKTKYDLIFSKYLLEHVKSVDKSYRNMYNSLNVNGTMIHIYPMGYHPYSLITRLIPNYLVKKLIPLLRPGSEGVTGYKTYYNLGSYYSLEKFFKSNNFKYKIKYYYGAEDYFSFLFPIGILVYFFNRICSILNIKIFSSGVLVMIKK